MNQNYVKVGDWVVCINNLYAENELTIGKKYKVIKVFGDGNYVNIFDNEDIHMHFSIKRFKKYQNELERIAALDFIN